MKGKARVGITLLVMLVLLLITLTSCSEDGEFHLYTSKVTTEATCEGEGVMTYTCFICNNSYTKPIAPRGHKKEVDEEVAPGCTTTGLTRGEHCSVCDTVLVPQTVIDETGHIYDWVTVKEANDTEPGRIDGTCVCGNVETRVVEKLSAFEFTLNSDGQSYSFAGIGSWTEGDVVIPDACNGKPVTAIEDRAFEECYGLTSISIPSSVTAIGAHSFYSCINLETLSYAGTVAQWNGISRGKNWAPLNLNGVSCSDDSASVQHGVTVNVTAALSDFSKKTLTYKLGDISVDLTFHGWPSITMDENGHLYAVCSARLRHSLPIGCNVLFKSTDGGTTWSDPVIIHDTPMDDRDTGIEYLGNGKILITFFTTGVEKASNGTYQTRFLKEGQTITTKDGYTIVGVAGDTGWHEQEPAWASKLIAYWQTCNLADLMSGFKCMISNDYGKSWSVFKKYDTPVSAPHGAIKLSSGELLYVGHSNQNRIFAYVSNNDGRTWTLKSTVAVGTPYSMMEPHVVELPDGRLIAAMRVNLSKVTIDGVVYTGKDVGGFDENGIGVFESNGKYYRITRDKVVTELDEKPETLYSGCVYITHSDDGGATWSEARPVIDRNGKLANGYPPEFTVTPEGTVVLSYAVREYGDFTVCATYSFDNGETWEAPVTLRVSSTSETVWTDHGYPSTVYLGDGEFITIFYEDYNRKNRGILYYTKWSVESGLSV